MSQPAYLVAQLKVKDFKEYVERYATPTGAQLQAVGAEVLVASRKANALEGELTWNWTVVIRFPSEAAATAWYDSPEYSPLKKIRTQEVTDGGSLVLAPGFDAAALG